jgi:hypothetical protein
MNPPDCHTLEAHLCDAGVQLYFRLGVADSIRLLCRRGAERDYATLAEDEPAPVTDARPKLDPARPEVRYYRAILSYAHVMCQFSNEIMLVIP